MDSQNNRFETLKDIFKDVKNILEKINNYGFFQRLFAWKLLKKDSTKLDSKLEDLQDIISDLRQKFNSHDDLNNVKIENDNLKKEITTYENTIDGEKKKLADAQNKYHNMIASQEKRQEKKEKEAKDKHDQEEADRKVSWQTHESEVSAFIQSECMKYDIQYIGPQDFPDRKKPDNSIIIDERYVIFDAKSPGDSQDSASFIRDLNQKAKDQEKYTKMPNVKKDIYLVVPSNLYPDIKKRHYPLGKFEAWIITMEQISVILAHYKKTMDYEKFEGLSQDDKDALIREMGNLEFNLRYKIMVDSVFGKKFLEAIKSSKDNLPEEINDEIEKVVTDSKDNVSRKDSGKPLSLDSIEREFNEANLLSQSRGIPTPPIEKKSDK
mgnify:FL=1